MLRRHVMAVLLAGSLLITSFPLNAQQPTASPPPSPQAATTGPQQPPPQIDPNDPIARIKDEGMNRSQVMQTLGYLTDVIGPRLTNSPNMKRANEWTRDKMASWGLQNAKLEAWGTFGRGWSLKSFSAQVVEPQAIPLIAYPKAWSPGVQGTLNAEVIHLDVKTEQDFEKYKGRLKGAIVLAGPLREVKAHFEPQGTRLTEKELLDLANAPDPSLRQGPPRQRFQITPEFIQQRLLDLKKANFIVNEGAALMIDSGRGDGGTLFVQSAAVPQPVPENVDPNNPQSLMALFVGRGTPVYDKSAPKTVPQIVVASEHYNRLVRMIGAGERVRMSVNLDVQFYDQDLLGYNTVAEIPGSDPVLKDEVVMLGGHMDSWHAATGATDNGAGVAVAMEAVRILRALNLQPRRTIRVALWSGEEQGLLGSRAYVREHFGEIEGPGAQAASFGVAGAGAVSLKAKPEHEKLSAYFNLDNGTGKIRGVYLQGNWGVAPIFRQWLAPFKDMDASTLSMSNTGGTDHLAFDAVGLPGFQFIQDEVEYESRTHHSNQDNFDRIQAEDMKQAATIMAAFVYQTAMRDEKLPRKPAPGR